MEGKTNTVTAIGVDYFFELIYAIRSPNPPFRIYKVECVKPVRPDIILLKETGLAKKVIEVPKGWEMFSEARIFSNYHLYGIKYVYADTAWVLEHINSGVMSYGKMFIDESYLIGESRRGGSSIVTTMTEIAQSMRKRGLEAYLLIQHGRFLDWRFRYIARRKILCRYNDNTHMISLLIQDLHKGTEKSLMFYAPLYWEFFDTNELPPMGQKQIAKAKSWA
jgi:hypothetical protein